MDNVFKKRIHPCADGQDAARAWDWLTALSPVLLLMAVNYRWRPLLAALTAAAGYLAAVTGWHFLCRVPLRAAPALLCGVLIACCMPSAAPLWLTALAGVVGGVAVGLPVGVNRLAKRDLLSCPVYFPPLAGYLAVRYAFAAHFSAFYLPATWRSADTVASATPLASLGQPASPETLSRLFWGFDAGSMGDGPAVALLMAFGFLLLRRRQHAIPTAAMVGTVALWSWLLWQTPLYSLLCGGTLLAAVLAGDEGFVHVGWKGRLALGVTAGAVTMLCRLWWRIDGAAIGLLAAAALTPLLHVSYHGLCRLARFLTEKFAKSKNKG